MALVSVNKGLSDPAQKREGKQIFTSTCAMALESLNSGNIAENEKSKAIKAVESAQAWINSNATASPDSMDQKLKEMCKVVDPITMKAKLVEYCSDLSNTLATKNVDQNEKAAIEKAISDIESWLKQHAEGSKEEMESKYRELSLAVAPHVLQISKRSGAVSGKMVYTRDGGYYFESDEKPTKARLLLEDSTGVVFIDLDECADDNSLACIVDDIQQRCQRGKVSKCIVMTITAQPKHPALHRYLMRSGAFMVGLRSCGIPIMGVVSGRVAGPAWSLIMTADYRFTTLDTIFHLPVCHSPQCLHQMVGPVTATELCLSTASLTATDVLELNLVNQARPTLDEAKFAAYEMAKRIASFPHVGLRQTLRLMNPEASDYVNAIGNDPSIMMQAYPDDILED